MPHIKTAIRKSERFTTRTMTKTNWSSWLQPAPIHCSKHEDAAAPDLQQLGDVRPVIQDAHSMVP